MFFFYNKENTDSLISKRKDEMFMVCKINDQSTRIYSCFKDYKDFLIKEDYHKKRENAYFEILDSSIHPFFKIYFDIDSQNHVDEETLIAFKDHISDILKEIINDERVNFKVIIYDSSNEEKFSYHYVVSGVKLDNINSLRNLCDHISSSFSFNNNFKNSIDKSVYKSVQQFRLIYTKKVSSPLSRLKRVFKKDISFDLEDFKESLISVTNDNDFLISFEYFKKEECVSLSIDLDDVPEKDFIENFLEKENNYSVRSVNEIEIDNEKKIYFIALNRHIESYCENCDRYHTSENPFIGIFENEIKFYCRRSDIGKVIYYRIKNIETKVLKKISKTETIF